MKKQLLTLGLCLLVILCRAQQNAGSQIMSVDPFTGIGFTNIPIHSFSLGNVDLNVSISYNMKGLTVDEFASSVGLGWSLNTGGGTITREVRGLEDEVTLPTSYVAPFPGYTLSMKDSLQGIIVPGWQNDTVQYDDLDPDIFTVTLGSRQLQFAFKTGSPTPVYLTSPGSEIKIELFTKDYVGGAFTNVRTGVKSHISEDSMKNILSFIITDESGNKFYFERGDYERKQFELYGFTKDTGIYYPTTTWNLQRIVSIYGDEARYTYVSKYVQTSLSQSEIYKLNAPAMEKLRIKEELWKGWKTHISKIETPGKIDILFDLDTSSDGRCDCKKDYRLRNIIVQSEHDPLYKNKITYRLNQSYFNTPGSYITVKEIPLALNCATLGSGYWNFPMIFSQADKDKVIDTQARRGVRLKLNSIDRIGTDNTTTQVYYSFDYNATALPLRYAPSKDYYGYHNGKSPTPITNTYDPNDGIYKSFYLSIPTSPSISFGLNRAADFNYTQSFVLNKITNGLGGITTVSYKDYSLTNPACSYGNLTTYPYFTPINCDIDSRLEGDTVNDGLVVWKITTADQFNQEANSTTEYTYLAGKRFHRGGYTWYPEPRFGQPIYTNSFTLQPDFFHGSNHGFDTVITTVTGYNNERISRQKTTFSNLMYYDAALGGYVSCLRKPTNIASKMVSGQQYMPGDFKKFRMGLPLRLEVYDEYDNLTSTQTNRFKFVSNPVEILANGHASGPERPADPNLDDFPTPWFYHVLDSAVALQDSSTIIQYEKVPGSLSKTFTTAYQYLFDEKNNIRRVLWTDSKGKTFKKYTYYTYGYSYASSPPITLINSLGLQHIMSTERWKMISATDSALLEYSLDVPDYSSTTKVITYSYSYGVPLSTVLPKAQANSSTYINRINAARNITASIGSALKVTKNITLYDEQFKVRESLVPYVNTYSAVIRDMDFGQSIAEVKNARHADIAYSSFEGTYVYQSPYNKGNWNFSESYIKAQSGVSGLNHALTGKFVYEIKPGDNQLQSNPLSERPYTLSYWLYEPASHGFSVFFANSSGTGVLLTPVLRKTVGSWKFYTVQFTPTATRNLINLYNQNGVLAGNSVYIDELRLYPTEATMTTATYKPLFGIGSACSADDQVTYYEYDEFGALKIERDIYGNIIKKTEYRNREAATNPTPISQTTY